MLCTYECSKCGVQEVKTEFELPTACKSCGAHENEIQVFCKQRFAVVAPWGQEVFASADKKRAEEWAAKVTFMPGFKVEERLRPEMVWPHKTSSDFQGAQQLPAWIRR